MPNSWQIKEHMEINSSDRKTIGKVDHFEGPDKIKLTRQSSPDGQDHHFIPLSWVDHVDQHVQLNKSGADVTAHWEHGVADRTNAAVSTQFSTLPRSIFASCRSSWDNLI